MVDSVHEVAYSGNRSDDALTRFPLADNRGTSLVQRGPPLENRVTRKSAADLAAAARQKAADLAAAITQRTVSRAQVKAEEQFEAAISTAIQENMAESRALAQASYDDVYHQGYYRAVKSQIAAKAAVEAASRATMAASQMAQVVGREVVFKILLEHTELGAGTTVEVLLRDLEMKIGTYSGKVQAYWLRHPQMPGLEAFLKQIRGMEHQVLARVDQVFDSEAMTRLMLGIVALSHTAMLFDYKIQHETRQIARVFNHDPQYDAREEMSTKMKSEVALFRFLKHMTSMEKLLQAHEDIKAASKVDAGATSDSAAEIVDAGVTSDSAAKKVDAGVTSDLVARKADAGVTSDLS